MSAKVSAKFKKKYAEYLKMIEKGIKRYFSATNITKNNLLQRKVFEAMEYAVCGGGKRIRPVMVLAAADICGGNMNDALEVALAVEFVHNYSLIHDDLPCMDNDCLRRGRETCHIVYGEDIALLAGDGLLNTAFEILSEKNSFRCLDYKRLLQIVKVLSGASGCFGMIGGQVVDLLCESKDNENNKDENNSENNCDLETLLYLHKRKTGALIRAAVVCGCMAANGDRITMCSLERYAESLGLAFQIKDDILDVEGNEEVLGKPIGSDKECGKSTFVSVLGMDSAKEYLEKETEKAKKSLKILGDKAWFFHELSDFLLEREY